MRKLACFVAAFAFVASAFADSITLKIEGMSCPVGCVSKVESTLAAIKGVDAKTTKVEMGKAVVAFDAAKTSKAEITKAVEKAGYTVAK